MDPFDHPAINCSEFLLRTQQIHGVMGIGLKMRSALCSSTREISEAGLAD